MTVTLRRLLATGPAGVRVLAGEHHLDRPVTWVAVSELTDPTPYLEGGELLLLTGVLLTGAGATGAGLTGARPAAAEPAGRYVQRLVERGVAAVGFGVGVVHERVPDDLVAAARAHQLPLLEVDRPTPFVAIGKALADLLTADLGERARRRLDAMHALTSALARGGEEAAAVRRLAALLDGWAALLDPRALVLSSAGPVGAADLTVAAGLARQLRSRGTHASATSADDTRRITVLPVGVGDRVRAYLAVGVAPGVESDHQLVTFAAALLTLDAERARGSRPLARWARATLLAQRLGAAPPPAPARILGPLGDSHALVRVLHVGSADSPVDLDRVLAAVDDEDEVCALDTVDGCVLVAGEDEAGRAAAALAGLDRAVGVSAALPGDGDLGPAAAYAKALAGCTVPGSVLRADEAPPTLGDLVTGAAAHAFSRSVLEPLRAGAGALEAPLLEQALLAWLAANGETGAAANTLGVHRHTLRERLRRARALLARDLDDPQVRVDLWVALRAAGANPADRARAPV